MSAKNTAARDPYLVKSVVHSSQLLSAFRTSGRGAAAAGDLGAQRAAEEHGLPAALHAGALRDDREGRREPLSLAHPPLQAEAVQARLCGAGHRLSVLEGSVGRPAAGRGGARRRAHLRRQPLQPEDRPAQRRSPGAREGRPGHRIPDRRARRRDRRGEVPRRRDSAHRARSAASRARPTSAPTTTKRA